MPTTIPHRFAHHPATRRRAGMSLLELLLVLAVLVVIAAIAAPSLERPLAAEKLRRGAQLVQAEWDRARIRAMQHGQIMVFQYQPASGSFRVLPWATEDVALEGSMASDPAVAAAGGGFQFDLPEGIEFYDSMTLSETRSLAVEEELVKLSSVAAGDASWSAPVLFYPDGTTSTAEMILSNETGSYVTLRLRGLTGVARVGPVLSTGTGERLE